MPTSTLRVADSADSRPGVRGWLSRGAWAMLDQASFSIANFLVLLLLGRWLAPADFGRFTVVHSIFILLGTIYLAVIVEAMLVFGPRQHPQHRDRYLGALLILQLPFAVGAALAFAAIALVCFIAHSEAMGGTMLAMAAATPMLLLLWLARRPCYMALDPSAAALGGMAYLLLIVAALFALVRLEALSTYSAIAVMAVASGLASVGLLAGERIVWPKCLSDDTLRQTARDHWHYGKWAMASGLLGLMPTQLCYLVLPSFAGVEASGVMRAVSNLILPLIQVNIAVCGLLLPALTARRDRRSTARLLAAAAALLVVFPAAAWILLGVAAEPIMRLCYGDRYADAAWLLWIIGACPALLGASMLLNTYLQSRQRQDAVFYSSLASAICVMTLGVWLTARDPLPGAGIGVCASLAVAIIVSASFAWSVSQRSQGGT